WPAQEISGIVLTPDGTPAANIPIYGWTLLEGDAGAWNNQAKRVYDLTTDDTGSFRLPVASPGNGVFWIVPDKFAPLSVVVSSDMQSLGVLHLKSGNKVRGILLDATGAPIAGIKVIARPVSPEAKDVMEFLKKARQRIQSTWQRETESDRDGRFELPPVVAGKYEVSVEHDAVRVDEDVHVITLANYAGVFVDQKLVLNTDEQEIVLKAVPASDIRFKTVDSEGRPDSGIRFSVFGRTPDVPPLSFAAMGKDKSPGLSVARVASKLNNVQVSIQNKFADIGGAFVVRPALKSISVYPGEYRMELKSVADIPEFQVTKFRVTTIDVTVVDAQNQPVVDAEPKLQAESSDGTAGSSPMKFKKLGEGRWRCRTVLPNVALNVTAEGTGWQSEKHVVTLREGEERELTVHVSR
ncbi:MAG: carboxypeptidase regulatory-like domain-containing protein, partial [Planctomycetaceae bacterium]|nr:carboxypeptidase regulatory-like domain-containing protein [Planctomycetaceae bacterium]